MQATIMGFIIASLFMGLLLGYNIIIGQRGGKPTIEIELNDQKFMVSKRYAKLVSRCNEEQAQYELITEYYEAFRPKDFVPEICFYYTELLAKKEKDLGVITELGDLYYEGVGTKKDPQKAVEIYKKALFLLDNPTEDLYIPQTSSEYREYICEKIKEYSK